MYLGNIFDSFNILMDNQRKVNRTIEFVIDYSNIWQ